MERHAERRADGEGVGSGDAARTQPGERGRRLAVDPQLHELAAQCGEQRGRGVERHDLAVVHDRDAIAETLGLVQVVGRHQDGEVARGAQPGDHVEQLVADQRI